MMQGLITPDRQAAVELRVFGSGESSVSLQAVIDTGFSGYLTLPTQTVTALGLELQNETTVTLGDGTERALSQFSADLEWDGENRTVLVLAAEIAPVIGMALLYGYNVHLHVLDGGTVSIEKIIP